MRPVLVLVLGRGVIGRTFPIGSLLSDLPGWSGERPPKAAVCALCRCLIDLPVSLLSYLHSVHELGSREQLSFLDTRHGDRLSCAGLVTGSANNMRKEWWDLCLELRAGVQTLRG